MLRRFLSSFIALLSAATVCFAEERPNVLFIAENDLLSQPVRDGVESIHSPNTDPLPESGFRFDRAYCQLEVSHPSGASQLRELMRDHKNTRAELSRHPAEQLRRAGDPRFVHPGHATLEINGWTIHLSDKQWDSDPVATSRMIELLGLQLQRVVDVVPPVALKQLRSVPIWINPPYPNKRPGAEYHPDPGWLERNDRDPIMGKAVEITNTRIFPFENRRMPYLLLHELAHAYHDQVLSFRNKEIKAAYEKAKASGTYDEVERFNGNKIVKDKAYAMTTPQEYFAELTEAYFGKNDFYPFNRMELKEHDPEGYAVIEKAWGVGIADKKARQPTPTSP
ncbi:MAG: hypothetical protein HRU46_14460 [Verrucomicrobiales bacterium]|nr:hypothetical protein [Verrucomicrobiales bacterium]